MDNIIKLYQDFGVDEIISDKPINRFNVDNNQKNKELRYKVKEGGFRI